MRRSAWTRISFDSCRALASRPPMPTGRTAASRPAQRPPDVADELDLRAVRGVDLGRLGVDVDDPLAAARVPGFRGVLDQVVADADDEVGPVEAGQDVVARLEPDRHEREVRPVVDGALAHERGGDRDVQAAREVAQVGRCVASEHAVAGQDQRPLRGRQQPGRVGDGVVGRFGEVGPARDERPGPAVAVVRDGHRGEVLGQLDVGRAGLLEGGDAECLADDLRDGLHPLDPGVPFRDRLHHPDDIDDLVGLLVEHLARGLAGDRDHAAPGRGTRRPRR